MSEQKTLTEDFDIFGGTEDKTKVSKINNQKHREIPKDKFNILEINKNTKQLGYKLELEQVINSIKTALEKIKIEEEMPVYKIIEEDLNNSLINVFNINPINEIKENISAKKEEIKLNLKNNVNGIPFTNIIFYDNKNKTLPIGMDLSSKMIIDLSQVILENNISSSFNIINFEDENDEFSKIEIKTVNVIE